MSEVEIITVDEWIPEDVKEELHAKAEEEFPDDDMVKTLFFLRLIKKYKEENGNKRLKL